MYFSQSAHLYGSGTWDRRGRRVFLSNQAKSALESFTNLVAVGLIHLVAVHACEDLGLQKSVDAVHLGAIVQWLGGDKLAAAKLINHPLVSTTRFDEQT